jgi:hypothetical protein
MRHLTLIGVVLILVGSWMTSLRITASRRTSSAPFSFAWSQSLFGLLLALVGLVLAIVGLASQPLVD